MGKDVLVRNVDVSVLQKQYEELQWLLDGSPQSDLWGLVEMIGDILDVEA